MVRPLVLMMAGLALAQVASAVFEPSTSPAPQGIYSCNAGATAATACPLTNPGGLTLQDTKLRAAATSMCGVPGADCLCYNTKTNLKCCNNALFDSRTHKCCGNSKVVALGASCECTASNTDSTTGINSGCPSTEPKCCVQTKFAELPGAKGNCYSDSTNSNQRCCNTGEVYEHATQQCCQINGVQSLDSACPCQDNSHCVSPNNNQSEHRICCRQTSPAVTTTSFCSIYANFPGAKTISNGVAYGVGSVSEQRCDGRCIDSRYEVCCNGAACASASEKCCGSECCNKFVGSCVDGKTQKQFHDNNGLKLEGTRCSIIEDLNPLKKFWIFVLPCALLLATLFGLATALAFIGKSANRTFLFVEKALIAVGVITVLASIPLFFSAFYKYGMFFVIVGIVALIAAAGKNKWLNILLIVLVVVALFFFFDPFHGSNLFNFSSYRSTAGDTDHMSDGVMRNTWRQWLNGNWCTSFYDHFQLDARLTDNRIENPENDRFGYCSRAWTFALLVAEGFIMIGLFLLFVLSVIGLLIRFRKEMLEPVELEVVPLN